MLETLAPYADSGRIEGALVVSVDMNRISNPTHIGVVIDPVRRETGKE